MEINVQESLKNYETVADEIKFLTNSLTRIKILSSLYQKPKFMKELNKKTKLNYSSISSNIWGLELELYIFKKDDGYHLSNFAKCYTRSLVQLNNTINVCDDLFNIFNNHHIKSIPTKSLVEAHQLRNSRIIESDEKDVYKTFNFILEELENPSFVKAIFPYYHEDFVENINYLVDKQRKIELFVSIEIKKDFLKKFSYKNKSTLEFFEKESNFLLIITDRIMMLGFFKDEGIFDQNRLIVSEDEDCIKWACNLFENFKKENK